MKLLIVTQKVDAGDQLLGFFVGWLSEFSKSCCEVHVFCLDIGEYTLPDNVYVHCLGKSEGKTKIIWLYRLLKYSWRLRKKYSNVFVHMNAIHIVFAGILWRVLGKRIGLWYTHPTVDMKLKLGTWLSHVVFTGSQSSFRIKTKKMNVMGQGVNPSFFTFKEKINLLQPQLVVVGRISPIKNVGISIELLSILRKTMDAQLHIVGGPSTDSVSDKKYLQTLKAQTLSLGVEDHIKWHGPKDAVGVQKILQISDIFVHTSLTHSADKTLPEAMASGLYVVSSNKAYVEDLPAVCFRDPNAEAYAESILDFTAMSEHERNRLRNDLRVCVEEKHSLARLIKNILGLY